MMLRWLLALLAVLGGFTAAGVLGALATQLAGFWHLPGAGFSAAFAVVVVAYLAAPDRKLQAASVALVAGAVVAWFLLEPSFRPEAYGDRGAYQQTHVPIMATYVGGLLGQLAAVLFSRKKAQERPVGPGHPGGPP